MSQLKDNLPALTLLQGMIVDSLADTASVKEASVDYRLARYEILSTFQRKVSGAITKLSAPEQRQPMPMPKLL